MLASCLERCVFWIIRSTPRSEAAGTVCGCLSRFLFRTPHKFGVKWFFKMPIKHFNYRAASSFYYIFVCGTPSSFPSRFSSLSTGQKVQRSEANELQRDLFIWLNVLECRCTVERMPHFTLFSFFWGVIFPKSNQEEFLKYMQVFYVENLPLFTFQWVPVLGGHKLWSQRAQTTVEDIIKSIYTMFSICMHDSHYPSYIFIYSIFGIS